MTRRIGVVALALFMLGAIGCAGAGRYINSNVLKQRVKHGMSQAQVQQILGEPLKATAPESTELARMFRVLEYWMVPEEATCPEEELGIALLNMITLGGAEAMRIKKARRIFRLYFQQGRYVGNCRVARGPNALGFCRQLEGDLIAKLLQAGYKLGSRTQPGARTAVPPPPPGSVVPRTR